MLVPVLLEPAPEFVQLVAVLLIDVQKIATAIEPVAQKNQCQDPGHDMHKEEIVGIHGGNYGFQLSVFS
jgi:hypothetical protein